ncbi:MAG: FeoB small GTPase domain-containing protein, partial [Limisphaerales bacterium]
MSEAPANDSLSEDIPGPSNFALVGNPNCGKTTLFNALTGLKQKVGNYPGVTVEKKQGECFLNNGQKISLLDLPGAYSLHARSPDEAVLRDVLLGRRRDTPRPEGILIVVDATNLERHLYLATQIMELGIPCILVLNMMDIVAERQMSIDQATLSSSLGGVPIIPMSAAKREGLIELKHAMARTDIPLPSSGIKLDTSIAQGLESAWHQLRETGLLHPKQNLLEPLYILSDRDPMHSGVDDRQWKSLEAASKALAEAHPGWEDRLVAKR